MFGGYKNFFNLCSAQLLIGYSYPPLEVVFLYPKFHFKKIGRCLIRAGWTGIYPMVIEQRILASLFYAIKIKCSITKMTKTTLPASYEPASVLTVHRPTKPTRVIKMLSGIRHYSNSQEYHREAVKSQIRNFCREAINKIESNCIVSVVTDEAGAHLVVSNDLFNFSFIYQEGGKL